MKFTYATEPPPCWAGEVLVDLLNLSIIQHNVDLIMHSEGIARNNIAHQGPRGGRSGFMGVHKKPGMNTARVAVDCGLMFFLFFLL